MHALLRASVLVPRISACLVVVVLLLVGCGGGSSGGDASSGGGGSSDGGSGPPPSGPAERVNLFPTDRRIFLCNNLG